MNQEKIGKFIAECRKEKNLTQVQLAEKLNMSYKSISKWETGRGMPDSSIMIELCNYLGINVNELLSGEHLQEEQYKEKANENIIDIAKESDKNRKRKNLVIIVMVGIFICSLIFIIGKSIYESVEIDVSYDERLIECKIENDSIVCSFNGLNLVHLDMETINTEKETLIFLKATMLVQNKIYSHYQSWDSMAQLISGQTIRFYSKRTIDISDYREKIKVYYTNISFNKIKKATQSELQEIIENSYLIAEK